MIPKFKIGDRVKSKFFDEDFVIHRISITALGIEYCDYNGVFFTEDGLAICIEPKPKVKKYLYASRYTSFNPIKIGRAFYTDDIDFLSSENTPHPEGYQRLDWSEIEVEE